MKTEHATVTRDGFEVPLIGIPKDAVEEKCDECGLTFHLSMLAFINSHLLCANCANEKNSAVARSISSP